MNFSEVWDIYGGSDGKATQALYDRLETMGPSGQIALNAFRAQKTSLRAKSYRRRFKGASYDRKQWSMSNLAQLLSEHGESLGIRWGWAEDPETPVYSWILYIDLPTGQISFHTAERGRGPDYPGPWDGVKNQGGWRVCHWIADLFAKEAVST